MADDLRRLIRAAYNNARLQNFSEAEAFDKAVEMLQRQRPLLSDEEARRMVRRMLRRLYAGQETK